MKKLALIIIALIAWFAIILQFSISLPVYEHDGKSAFDGFITVLSYFTIQSNILVAVCSTGILLAPESKAGRFLGNISFQTAVELYILIVGLTYNTVLRSIWKPEGWFIVANELLHVVVPVLFTVYWLFIVPKGALRWSSMRNWLIYPLVYLVYTIVRGVFVNWYPYPFLDVSRLGYGGVIVNSIMMTIIISFIALVLTGIDRMGGRNAADAE